jgi:L-serine dehydratase
MNRAILEKKTLSGPFIGEVISKALKMGESNACMKKIVAAPTAGACGVIPAVLLTYEETYNASMQQMIKALYVASGIGEVIASRAFLAGAAGGCQAEIGSASAMAAGALVFLNGGDQESIAHAAAMSLKNLLGLVCDTVGGLVEVPCVKRNVVGAVNAIASADMAVAGIRSQIPPDEVIDAMREIGEALTRSLRETGEGGLAATPTGQEIMDRLIKQ